MAVGFVQTASVQSNTDKSLSVTLGATPTVGNVMFMFVSADGNVLLNGWVIAASAAQTSTRETILYRVVQAGDGTTQPASGTASIKGTLNVTEFSGVGGAVLGTFVAGTGSNSFNVPVPQASGVVITMAATYTVSSGGSWTETPPSGQSVTSIYSDVPALSTNSYHALYVSRTTTDPYSAPQPYTTAVSGTTFYPGVSTFGMALWLSPILATPPTVNVVQYATAQLNTAGTLQCTLGATPTTGNLLLALTHAATAATPTGWTNKYVDGTELRLDYRIVQAGDGKTWGQASTSNTGCIAVLEITGQAPTNYLNVGSYSSNVNPGTPAYTVPYPSGLMLAAFGANNGANYPTFVETPPSGQSVSVPANFGPSSTGNNHNGMYLSFTTTEPYLATQPYTTSILLSGATGTNFSAVAMWITPNYILMSAGSNTVLAIATVGTSARLALLAQLTRSPNVTLSTKIQLLAMLLSQASSSAGTSLRITSQARWPAISNTSAKPSARALTSSTVSAILLSKISLATSTATRAGLVVSAKLGILARASTSITSFILAKFGLIAKTNALTGSSTVSGKTVFVAQVTTRTSTSISSRFGALCSSFVGTSVIASGKIATLAKTYSTAISIASAKLSILTKVSQKVTSAINAAGSWISAGGTIIYRTFAASSSATSKLLAQAFARLTASTVIPAHTSLLTRGRSIATTALNSRLALFALTGVRTALSLTAKLALLTRQRLSSSSTVGAGSMMATRSFTAAKTMVVTWFTLLAESRTKATVSILSFAAQLLILILIVRRTFTATSTLVASFFSKIQSFVVTYSPLGKKILSGIIGKRNTWLPNSWLPNSWLPERPSRSGQGILPTSIANRDPDQDLYNQSSQSQSSQSQSSQTPKTVLPSLVTKHTDNP